MSNFFIGHWLANLIVPGDPDKLTITTPAGQWLLSKAPNFTQAKAAIISGGQCAKTYAIEFNGTYSGSRAAAMDAADADLIPICLGASYLTALSVAPTTSLPGSDISFLQVGDHFPRVRAMGSGFPIIHDEVEFVALLERCVLAYPGPGVVEKIRLISHHFLDALAYWSLEDLVLSTTTILEIIAATAKQLAASAGTPAGDFKHRMIFAAARFNLPPLPSDFRNMRNDLVHEGSLSGSRFPGKTSDDCGLAAAEALDWIDEYLFAALSLGTVPTNRFVKDRFRKANSFSL